MGRSQTAEDFINEEVKEHKEALLAMDQAGLSNFVRALARKVFDRSRQLEIPREFFGDIAHQTLWTRARMDAALAKLRRGNGAEKFPEGAITLKVLNAKKGVVTAQNGGATYEVHGVPQDAQRHGAKIVVTPRKGAKGKKEVDFLSVAN